MSKSPSLKLDTIPAADRQWIFTPEEIKYSPSIVSGLDPAIELNHRALAVRRIWTLKDILNVPTNVVTTSAVYIHRFYMRETMQAHAWPMLAGAAFFLAAKVEEQPRRLRDIVGITADLEAHRIPTQVNGRFNFVEESPKFREMKKKILFYEGILLTSLCFDLNIIQPSSIMLNACAKIWATNRVIGKDIESVAWMILSDSLHGTSCLTHRAEILAAAAIACACHQLRIPLPSISKEGSPSPTMEEGEEREPEVHWLDQLHVSESELAGGITALLSCYQYAEDDYVLTESAVLVEAVKITKPIILKSSVPLSTIAPPPFISTVAPPPLKSAELPTQIVTSIESKSEVSAEIDPISTTPPLVPQITVTKDSSNIVSDVDMTDGTNESYEIDWVKVEKKENITLE